MGHQVPESSCRFAAPCVLCTQNHIALLISQAGSIAVFTLIVCTGIALLSHSALAPGTTKVRDPEQEGGRKGGTDYYLRFINSFRGCKLRAHTHTHSYIHTEVGLQPFVTDPPPSFTKGRRQSGL